MKRLQLLLILIFCSFLAVNVFAQEQKEPPSTEEMALKEAERLEKELSLEFHQTFYVDSILQYNFRGLKDEFEKMQKSGRMEPTVYEAIRKKWMDKTDAAYKKVFTEEQFERYLLISGQKKPDKAAAREAKRKEKEALKMKKAQEKAAKKAAKLAK